MDHIMEKNNKVYLRGTIVSEAVFSHEVYGEGFYELFVRVSCCLLSAIGNTPFSR